MCVLGMDKEKTCHRSKKLKKRKVLLQIIWTIKQTKRDNQRKKAKEKGKIRSKIKKKGPLQTINKGFW